MDGLIAWNLVALVGSIVWFAAGPHPFGIRISRDLS